MTDLTCRGNGTRSKALGFQARPVLGHHTLVCPRRYGEYRQCATTAECAWQAGIHSILYPDSLWHSQVKITRTTSRHTIASDAGRRDDALASHLQVDGWPPIVAGPIGLLDRKIMKLPGRVQYGGARAGIGSRDIDREADKLAFCNKTAKVFRWTTRCVASP